MEYFKFPALSYFLIILALIVTQASSAHLKDKKIDTTDKGGFSIVVPSKKLSIKNPDPSEAKSFDLNALFAFKGWITGLNYQFHEEIPKADPPIYHTAPMSTEEDQTVLNYQCIEDAQENFDFRKKALQFLPHNRTLILMSRDQQSTLIGYIFDGQLGCKAVVDKSLFESIGAPYEDFKMIKRSRKEGGDQFDPDHVYLCLSYPKKFKIQVLFFDFQFGGKYEGKMFDVSQEAKDLGVTEDSSYVFSRVDYENEKQILIGYEIMEQDGLKNGVLFSIIEYGGQQTYFNSEDKIPRFKYPIKDFKMTYKNQAIILVTTFKETEVIAFTAISIKTKNLEIISETQYVPIEVKDDPFLGKEETIFELEDEIIDNRIRMYFATATKASYVIEEYQQSNAVGDDKYSLLEEPLIKIYHNLPNSVPVSISYFENTEFFQFSFDAKNEEDQDISVSFLESLNRVDGYPLRVIESPRLKSNFKKQPNLLKFLRKERGANLSPKFWLLMFKPPKTGQEISIETFNLRSDFILYVRDDSYLNLTHDTFKVTSFNEDQNRIFTLITFFKFSKSGDDPTNKYLVTFLVFLGLFVIIFLCIGFCHFAVFKNKDRKKRKKKRKIVKKQIEERDPSVVYMADLEESTMSIGGRKEDKLLIEEEEEKKN